MDANAARFGERPPGSVELTDLATLRKVGPALYEGVRARQPGAITRTERWWDLTCELVTYPGDDPFKGFVAIGRDASGEPDGYVRYKVEGSWADGRPTSTLEILELLAATPDAYARLWRYCCEVDWVATVKAPDRCHDEALPWLLADARVITRAEQWDFVWLRPLDVASLLSSRCYLTDGRVVLEVVDPGGLAGGRFALDGGPDGASCARHVGGAWHHPRRRRARRRLARRRVAAVAGQGRSRRRARPGRAGHRRRHVPRRRRPVVHHLVLTSRRRVGYPGHPAAYGATRSSRSWRLRMRRCGASGWSSWGSRWRATSPAASAPLTSLRTESPT